MKQINNIAKLRDAKKWTQETLATKSGVNRIMIARYETQDANMTVETAKKLADALGCSIDDLFNADEQPAS